MPTNLTGKHDGDGGILKENIGLQTVWYAGELQINRALRGCSHGQMLDQIYKTIPPTLRQQRHRVLDAASERVPETGPRERIESG